MALSRVWVILILFSLLFALINGRLPEVSSAALEGAREAVTLAISLAGTICFWCGILEVMKRSGLSEKLSKLLRPLLSRLIPGCAKNSEAMDAVAANVSANFLGLGNAATPLGIKALKSMRPLPGGTASNDMCLFVVLNTASIQLIPATVAAIRASLGAENPFEILPAVWITSAVSLTAGVIAAKIMEKRGGR